MFSYMDQFPTFSYSKNIAHDGTCMDTEEHTPEGILL